MKNFLYVDKTFIYSYLSQKGKGLNSSYSHMIKNATSETDSESFTTINSKHNINAEEDGSINTEFNIGMVKTSLQDSSKYIVGVDIASIQKVLKTVSSNIQTESELHNIELHDYMYEIFMNSINNDLKSIISFSDKNVSFVELGDPHSIFLNELISLFSEEPTSSFIGQNEKEINRAKNIKTDFLPAYQKISNVINKIIPGDLKFVFEDDNSIFIGPIYKENITVPFSELKYFYNNTNLIIVGIKTNNFSNVNFENNDNTLNQLQLDVSMSNILVPSLFPGKELYSFKPILIYTQL